MNRVYILGSCRTPIGKMGGALSSLSAVELGAIAIKEAMKRAGVVPEQVEHVYMGCVIQAGLGQNVARQAAVRAGIPYEATAETLNCVCGSGLDAVNSAANLIRLGEADIVIAGGTESMSNAPFAMLKGRFGYRLGYPGGKSELVDTMVNDALWDVFNDYHMGITAENVAQQWHISRTEQDLFALCSQQKACQATQAGSFAGEIIPIEVKVGKETVVVDKDESLRANTSMEGLAKLAPAFKPDGTVTAGNASGISDGAAAVVVMSEEKLKELGLEPECEWLGGAMVGLDPAIMGMGSAVSARKLLSKLGLSMDGIDLVEANEAFAAQSLAVLNDLGLDPKKANVNGGAIALGHPVGASGCRILVTLMHAMRARAASTGLATLCIGGGMGCSTVVKSCSGRTK